MFTDVLPHSTILSMILQILRLGGGGIHIMAPTKGSICRMICDQNSACHRFTAVTNEQRRRASRPAGLLGLLT